MFARKSSTVQHKEPLLLMRRWILMQDPSTHHSDLLWWPAAFPCLQIDLLGFLKKLAEMMLVMRWLEDFQLRPKPSHMPDLMHFPILTDALPKVLMTPSKLKAGEEARQERWF